MTDPRKAAVLATLRRMLPELRRRRVEYGETPAYDWLVDKLCTFHPYAMSHYMCDVAAVLDGDAGKDSTAEADNHKLSDPIV